MSAAWVSAACALCVAVAGLLVWGGRTAFRLIKRTMHFLDDYFGEPSRAGVPERPGVMSRLQALSDDLSEIRGQVFPNGGHSLRDDVKQIRDRMEQLESQRSDREDA